jgi:hypothetical protein
MTFPASTLSVKLTYCESLTSNVLLHYMGTLTFKFPLIYHQFPLSSIVHTTQNMAFSRKKISQREIRQSTNDANKLEKIGEIRLFAVFVFQNSCLSSLLEKALQHKKTFALRLPPLPVQQKALEAWLSSKAFAFMIY